MQGMRPRPLANFLCKFGQNLDPFGQIWVKFRKIWVNLNKLGKIWVNLVKFVCVWAKIKILHPQKLSISNGYDHIISMSIKSVSNAIRLCSTGEI